MSEQEIYVKRMENPVVTDPVAGLILKDNPYIKNVFDLDFKDLDPILDARAWNSLKKDQSKTAAIGSDPLKIADVFLGKHADIATQMFSDIREARRTRNASLAAAIITSKDYSLLQDSVVVAENPEFIETGVVSGLFEETAINQISGKYRDFAHDLKWFRNIPEGKSPEPSFGSVSEVSFRLFKHGGAVAITDRARDVINGGNIFSRLVNQLQEVRLADENDMVVDEIETNTTNTEAGVDFGQMTGTASTNNPKGLIAEINADFGNSTRPELRWDLFITKSRVFSEYVTNTFVSGSPYVANPAQNPENGNISSGIPGFPSYVTWVRADEMALDSGKDAIAMNRSAIRKFRGPTRQYTITDPEKEYTKYTTKTHFAVETIKPELIYLVTDIYA
jgi:hypothetical protein